MTREEFVKNTVGSLAVWEQGTGDRYVLVAAQWIKNGERAIHVTILEENGQPAIGVFDWHHFGDGANDERFMFAGSHIEHVLGDGSVFMPPNKPPNRISIAGNSDLVFSGLPVGQHGTMRYTFQLRTVTAPPPSDAPTLFTPEQLSEIRAIVRDQISGARIEPRR